MREDVVGTWRGSEAMSSRFAERRGCSPTSAGGTRLGRFPGRDSVREMLVGTVVAPSRRPSASSELSGVRPTGTIGLQPGRMTVTPTISYVPRARASRVASVAAWSRAASATSAALPCGDGPRCCSSRGVLAGDESPAVTGFSDGMAPLTRAAVKRLPRTRSGATAAGLVDRLSTSSHEDGSRQCSGRSPDAEQLKRGIRATTTTRSPPARSRRRAF